MKTTFTAEDLLSALEKSADINRDFPELPIELPFCKTNELWSEETFPITFKKIGKDEHVTVFCEEYHVGEGLEAGDNSMYIILRVGRGEDKRFFKKTGFLDSWDNGYDDYRWDGGLYEVKPKEVTRVEYEAV